MGVILAQRTMRERGGRRKHHVRLNGAWRLAVFIRIAERRRIEGTHAERGERGFRSSASASAFAGGAGGGKRQVQRTIS